MRRLTCEVTGDEVFHERLPQGSDLYVYRTRGMVGKHALLAVDYGSVDLQAPGSRRADSRDSPHGIAHFLEHRLFEKSQGDITGRFTALGAEVEAQTSFISTVFSFACVDHFESSLKLLMELVLEPHFTSEGVEREREIVSREIRLFEDSLEWVSFHNALKALYGRHPLAVDMAGTLASVAEIDLQYLQQSYDAFYRPERMAIFLCGDVEAERYRDIADEAFCEAQRRARKVQAGTGVAPARQRPLPTPSRLSLSMPLSTPRLCLAFHDRAMVEPGRELLKREICLEMTADILFGPASDFFAQQYAGGHIEAESFACESYVEQAFCFTILAADVDDPDRVEEAVHDEISRTLKGGVAKEEFERARRKAFGQLIYHYDEGESCAAALHSAVARGGGPFEFFDAHAEIGLDDVVACLESAFSMASCGTCTVLPEKPAHGVTLATDDADKGKMHPESAGPADLYRDS